MEEYKPRARVLCALEHSEPDRVPVDFASTRSSGVNALAYGNLLRYLGRQIRNKVFDMKQLLSEVDDEIRVLMGGDVIQLHRLEPSLGVKLNEGEREEVLMDGSRALVPAGFHYTAMPDGSAAIMDSEGRRRFVRPSGGMYFDDVYHPLENAESIEDIDENLSLPMITEEELGYLEKRARDLYDNTPYAIVATTSVSIFERGFKDFGFENYLTYLAAEREMTEYYLDRMTDAYIGVLDAYLGRVGDYIQVIQFNDDYGTQQTTLISPAMFREVMKPKHAKIHSFVKSKRPELKIFFHCCGAISTLIPDLIDTGIDILNPVQLSAAGMDPAFLKKEYGGHLVFWGGACSTQTVMTFGTTEDVRRQAKEMTEIFAPGGGFVFCQDHNIQHNVPPENIAALYQAAGDYGVYRH
jgi:uroporphyrinogen decarboxylase